MMSQTALFRSPKLCAAAFTACLALSYSCHAGKDPIQGNAQGYWSHGIVIGSLADTGITGCILPSQELLIYSGIHHRALRQRRQILSLSTTSPSVFSVLQKKAQEHVEAPANHSKRIALHYLHPFPLNKFHRNKSQYWVTSQSELKHSFTSSESYKKYGYEYEDDTPPPCHSFKGVVHGKIFEVSRWGIMGKVCTISLEENRVTEVHVSIPEEYHSSGTSTGFGQNTFGGSSSDGENTISTSQTSQLYLQDTFGTHDRIVHDTMHTRFNLNLYTEAGCKFAEDAILNQANVSVYYTTDCMPTWNWHSRRVYKIQVSDEKKKL